MEIACGIELRNRLGFNPEMALVARQRLERNQRNGNRFNCQ